MNLGDSVSAAVGILSAVLGTLTGSSPSNTDAIEAHFSERADLLAKGWRDWIPPYVNTLDPAGTPYDYPRVWVWRPSWTGLPYAADPHSMDSAMNVVGLYWKPWRPDDAAETAGRTVDGYAQKLLPATNGDAA